MTYLLVLFVFGVLSTGGIADIGTFTAILGPSGAGKSLLLDCLALRNRDFRGMVMVDGRPFKGPFGSLAGKLKSMPGPVPP